jgi:RNA polymerase sigma-70 factor, ECF subfamily
MPSDPTLSDESAFEAVFRTYSPALFRFIYGYVRSTAIAEELVQDVFLRLWEQRAWWVEEEALRARLYTVARSRALDYLRHEEVAKRLQPEVESRQLTDDRLADDELNTALRRAIDELPSRCREAFTLYWQQGMRYAEVAKVMGVSEKTVENQLAIALKTLRGRLWGFFGSRP